MAIEASVSNIDAHLKNYVLYVTQGYYHQAALSAKKIHKYLSLADTESKNHVYSSLKRLLEEKILSGELALQDIPEFVSLNTLFYQTNSNDVNSESFSRDTALATNKDARDYLKTIALLDFPAEIKEKLLQNKQWQGNLEELKHLNTNFLGKTFLWHMPSDEKKAKELEKIKLTVEKFLVHADNNPEVLRFKHSLKNVFTLISHNNQDEEKNDPLRHAQRIFEQRLGRHEAKDSLLRIRTLWPIIRTHIEKDNSLSVQEKLDLIHFFSNATILPTQWVTKYGLVLKNLVEIRNKTLEKPTVNDSLQQLFNLQQSVAAALENKEQLAADLQKQHMREIQLYRQQLILLPYNKGIANKIHGFHFNRKLKKLRRHIWHYTKKIHQRPETHPLRLQVESILKENIAQLAQYPNHTFDKRDKKIVGVLLQQLPALYYFYYEFGGTTDALQVAWIQLATTLARLLEDKNIFPAIKKQIAALRHQLPGLHVRQPLLSEVFINALEKDFSPNMRHKNRQNLLQQQATFFSENTERGKPRSILAKFVGWFAKRDKACNNIVVTEQNAYIGELKETLKDRGLSKNTAITK